MKLTDQVVSLELAKKLKELGVKQESLFSWRNFKNPKLKIEPDIVYLPGNIATTVDTFFAAYTVAELGEVLGRATSGDLLKAYGHAFNLVDVQMITTNGLQYCLVKPDIAGKMLIYLLENKLVTLCPRK